MAQRHIKTSNDNEKVSEDKQFDQTIQNLINKIEYIKQQYNLFFAGELRVPPEKERTDLEKQVRKLLSQEQKRPRTALLVQNVTASFTLFNNMWLKRLNDVETGVSVIAKKKVIRMHEFPEKKAADKNELEVNLENDDSFNKFFTKYCEITELKTPNEQTRDKIVSYLKTRMLSSNMVGAKVTLTMEKNKLMLKMKKTE